LIALALLLQAGAPGATATEPPPPRARIESIRVQLYYELSGTLSANIAPPANFTGWNTVIGEGDAKEAAQDVLVSVQLGSDGSDGFLTDRPLLITARNGKGKVIGTRSASAILVPYRGTVSTALWLRNATCAGKIGIEAQLGKQVRRTSVTLHCGE
jgi:hypothetical protein